MPTKDPKDKSSGFCTASQWGQWIRTCAPRYPNEKVVQFVFRNFPRKNARRFRFLDIGMGGGVNSLFLHREHYLAHGVDIAPAGIERLRRETGFPKRFRLSSIDALDFPSGSFHGLICIGVLETVAPAIAAAGVREAARVLKKGGIGFFFFAARGDFRMRQTCLLRKFYTRAEVRRLFLRAGFRKFHIDQGCTTYANDAYRQKDWLVTVFK